MPSFFLQKSRKTAAAERTAEQSRAAEVDLAEQSSRAEGGGGEADADAGGQVALVVPGERAWDVDGLVAVAAEERPVLDAEDEGRLLLADVAAREPGGERLEREALVLAGELVGGVDLDVAARAQRRLVGAAHHRGRRGLARVALDPHAAHAPLLLRSSPQRLGGGTPPTPPSSQAGLT